MHNFLDPAILFFLIGALAGAVKSNLEVPHPIARFLSLYLLMALGLKGGFALQKSGFTLEIGLALGLAVFLATLIPLMGYALLRTRLNPLDSAAVAALAAAPAAFSAASAALRAWEAANAAAASSFLEGPSFPLLLAFLDIPGLCGISNF
jgi:hypothetical protein